MATPVAPAKFVHPDDVNARYEGTIPAAKLTTVPPGWVQLRIEDVEGVLIGLVPSLGGVITDEARLRRVKTLVCDKVLELYRNPARSSSQSQTMDGFTESTVFNRDFVQRSTISFTEEELNRVRPPRTRRPNLGMARLAPWNRPC